ncbi:MAG: serine/threonine-protein kinase [Acidobacteriota bacterium]
MVDGPSRFGRVEELFHAALDQRPDDRRAFVIEACGEDEALRGRVLDLLAADEATGNPLDETVAELGARLMTAGAAGQRIGPHRLLREIGRGGMGTIYLAERDDGQYREEVAIKLIRRGMDSDGFVRRFRQERQILASLHHPNIARVLDGGLTELGLPYFVMEYIDGQPIDRYCDARRLSLTQRLELFLEVCGAVQAAHGRLVVHCDLKPSNILVTRDGIPKLLDFGIARLLDSSGASDTSHPTVSNRLMTPEFASPEQIRGEALSTASDVYSLAGVLYRLLTGRRPYRLTTENRYELERAVCEQEPDHLSAAIERLRREDPERLYELSRARRASPDGLRRRLAGDLDTVVAKALAKPPELRYASPDQLAEDLRRHQRGLPVLARKPTLGYRTGKFVRRHRAGVVATLLVTLSLVVGMVGTSHQASVARARETTAEETLKFLLGLFERNDPDAAEFGTMTLRDVFENGAENISDTLRSEPLARARVLDTLGEIHRKLGLFDRAGPLLEEALATRRRLAQGSRGELEVAASLHHLGLLQLDGGRLDAAETALTEALELRRRRLGEASLETSDSLNSLGLVRRKQRRLEEATQLFRRALAVRRELLGDEHLETTATLNNLASVLRQEGELEEAEALYREVLAVRRRALEGQHPRLATTLNNLARVLRERKAYAEAEPLYLEALEIQRALGRLDRVATILNNLGRLREKMGDSEAAERLLAESVEVYRQVPEGDAAPLAFTLEGLGDLQLARGELEAAEAAWREALELLEQRFGVEYQELAPTAERLGRLLCATGRSQEGERWLHLSLNALQRREESLESPSGSQGSSEGLARVEQALQACQR